VHAGLLAHGSPISRSFLSRLYVSHVPSQVPTVLSVPLRLVSGITLSIGLLWELCRHEPRGW